jgi:hypothetical protein
MRPEPDRKRKVLKTANPRDLQTYHAGVTAPHRYTREDCYTNAILKWDIYIQKGENVYNFLQNLTISEELHVVNFF